jgi:hypothetical protein
MFHSVLILITLVACMCFDCEGEDYGLCRQNGWRHVRLVGKATAEAVEQRRLRGLPGFQQVEGVVEPAAGQHQPTQEEDDNMGTQPEHEWEHEDNGIGSDGGEAGEASSSDDEADPDPYMEELRETVAGMCEGEIQCPCLNCTHFLREYATNRSETKMQCMVTYGNDTQRVAMDIVFERVATPKNKNSV